MQVRIRPIDTEACELARWAGHAPIAVITPHAGDEVLGCGHLLLAAFESTGAHVFCLSTDTAEHETAGTAPAPTSGGRTTDALGEAVRRLGGYERDLTRFHPGMSTDPFRNVDADRVVEAIRGQCAAMGTRLLFSTAPCDRDDGRVLAASVAREVMRRMPDISVYFYPIDSRWPRRRWPDQEHVRAFRPCDTSSGRQRKRFALAAYHPTEEDPDAPALCGKGPEPEVVDYFVDQPEIFLPD